MPRPDPTVLDDLAAMPDYVADRLGALDAEDARRPGPDASLSPVEQCWHLADLEAEGLGGRTRRLLGEERPFLADFDGARLAQERRYREKSLAGGLAAFRAARQANLALLRGLADGDWQRGGVQEGVGEVTLSDVPRLMREHDASHRAEIAAWLERR